MEGFIVLVGLIWSILCIVLFFKVWKACNNIQRLADKYAPENVKKTMSVNKENQLLKQEKILING